MYNVPLINSLYPELKCLVADNFDHYLALARRPGLGRTKFDWLDQALIDCWSAFGDMDKESWSPLVQEWRKLVVAHLDHLDWDKVEKLDRDISISKLPPKVDAVEAERGLLVQFDLTKANYNALRQLSEKSLPEDWEVMCDGLGVPKALARSRAFRQHTLGLVHPKVLQRFQSFVTAGMHSMIKHQGYRLVRRSPDELVYAKDFENSYITWYQVAIPVPYRVEHYTLEPLGWVRGFLRKNYTHASLVSSPGLWQVASIELFGVPGNKYWAAYQASILNEPIDRKSKQFVEDGTLAEWQFGHGKIVGKSMRQHELPDLCQALIPTISP